MTIGAEHHAGYGLRTPDSIVGATALVAGTDRLVTNDRRMKVLEQEGLRVELISELASA